LSDAHTPGRIGIVTAGTTAPWAQFVGEGGIVAMADREGPQNPPDAALAPFIVFSNRVSRGAPNASYTIVGNVKTEDEFAGAVDELVDAGLDMVVWWSLALSIGSDGAAPSAAERSVRRGAERGTIFVYPCYSGPRVDLPSVAPVGGVEPSPPGIAVCPPPPNDSLQPPVVVSWGDWMSFRLAWRAAGITDELQERDPGMNPHCLAVWSIAAWLGLGLNAPAVGRGRLDVRGLRRVCVPVTVQPSALNPVLGMFEPRFLDRFRA